LEVDDVSAQLIGPSSKDQAVKEGFLDIMTLEDGADGQSQNVGHNYQHTLHTIPDDLRLMCNDTDGIDLFMMLWHQVPIAATTKMTVRRDIKPCSLTGVHRRFGGTCYLRTHGRSILTTEARDPSKVCTLLHHTTINCSISTEVHFNKKHHTSDCRTPRNKWRCTGLSSLHQ